MLNVKINSYDEHFDTFACTFTQDNASFESLIPAVMLPYIAPNLCNRCEDLPYDAVHEPFTLELPNSLCAEKEQA